MKRCVFVGPSLYGVSDRPAQIEFRPPAQRGDLIRAAASGVRWIGLIDGYFGTCASVWHKEILYALSLGCHVWGASSMGALRAAECQSFGMRPVGSIALGYASGLLVDDAEVALVHGPPEAAFVPFTEPMVDVRATIDAIAAAGALDQSACDALLNEAKSLHFSERTVDEMAMRAGGKGRELEFASVYEKYRVRAKQLDASLLVKQMLSRPPLDRAADGWRPAWSASMATLVEELQALEPQVA